MSLAYIVALNASLLGFAYYHDRKVESLKKQILNLEAVK